MFTRSASPAVYGIENEYSCFVTLPDDVVYELVGSCHSEDKWLGLYQEPDDVGASEIPENSISEALQEIGIYRTESGMLSNGARLYMDPSGPEYCTPETSTAAEAVIRSFDGDKIMLGVFEHLRKNEIIKAYQLNRRVVDHNRSSRGVHLNTLTQLSRREQPAELVKNWLATLNVVKGAIFGSGGLLVDAEGQTAFHHSPRLSITSDVSANFTSYRDRPLVRYPFKPDGRRLGRIETVTSDALNFAWPLRASQVVTNALVGIIELGYGNKLPLLSNPVHSAHVVGRYGNGQPITAISKRGKSVSVRPLDVLRHICEVVQEIDSKEKHLDKESVQVIPELIEIADKVSEDEHAGADQVESIARKLAMKRRMDSKGIRLDSERMCRFDYAWDLIGGGVAETLRTKKGLGWKGFSNIPSDAGAKKRLGIPPQDTRARVRGDLIREDKGNNESAWDVLEIHGTPHYMHPLSTQVY